MDGNGFSDSAVLSYLGLPRCYSPSPSESPIEFLHKFLHGLPPHLTANFALITTPRQRSAIHEIRNRRLGYTRTMPTQLAFESASVRWAHLWPGHQSYGRRAGEEERRWASKEFMGGIEQKVGKLGALLGEYEQERQAMSTRRARNEGFVPEDDDDDDDDDDDGEQVHESVEESKVDFERRIRELFIYGLLEVRAGQQSTGNVADGVTDRVLITTCLTGVSNTTPTRTCTRKSSGSTRRRRTRRRTARGDKYGNYSEAACPVSESVERELCACPHPCRQPTLNILHGRR